MDTNKMKELVKKFGTILIMKDDNPDVIIMDYNKYLEMEGAPATSAPVATPAAAPTPESAPTPAVSPKRAEEEATLIDNLNKEIQSLNQEIEAQTGGSNNNSETPNHDHEPVMV